MKTQNKNLFSEKFQQAFISKGLVVQFQQKYYSYRNIISWDALKVPCGFRTEDWCNALCYCLKFLIVGYVCVVVGRVS